MKIDVMKTYLENILQILLSLSYENDGNVLPGFTGFFTMLHLDSDLWLQFTMTL